MVTLCSLKVNEIMVYLKYEISYKNIKERQENEGVSAEI